MATFDVVSIGGAVRDITLYTNKGMIMSLPENLTEQMVLAFEYGAKIPVFECHTNPGGGAINTCSAFSKLGMRTMIFARIGNDSDGEIIKAFLKKMHISLSGIQNDNAKKTGFSFILAASKKDHDHIIFTYRGANEDLLLNAELLSSTRAKYYYVSSLCGNVWQKTLNSVFSHAEKQGSKIFWNPGGQQLSEGAKTLTPYLRKSYGVILNKDEAIELVLSGIRLGKRNPKFLNHTPYLLHMISEWGPKIVVITEGVKGASAIFENVIYKMKAVKKKKIVDTTGVGDAFAAGFIAGLHYHKNHIMKALTYGVHNGANVLGFVGAQNGQLTLSKIRKKFS